jgi:hypothetical protein
MRSRLEDLKGVLPLRALPMLAALITFLTGTILLGAMGAILFLYLATACHHRSGKYYGRHGQ